MLSSDLKSANLGHILEDALIRAREVVLAAAAAAVTDDHDLNRSSSSVVFLGMDAPELSLILNDIHTGLWRSSLPIQQHPTSTTTTSTAMLCPADDGGYVMLCVPPQADASRVFAGVHWSHALTAVSQLKALTDLNDNDTNGNTKDSISVKIGRLAYDIDESQDVKRLCERLLLVHQEEGTATTTTTNDDNKASDNDELVLYQNSNSGSSSSTRSGYCVRSDHPECYFTRQALSDLGQL
jgi:hypothetical protein